MKHLMDIIRRRCPPIPWGEGDNIPWNDPAFSQRMLVEHLSQDHPAASRQFDRIDTHIDWIHSTVLSGTPSRVLDLGCGPGLYSSRLAQLGHQCTGIDYSPASIAYARRMQENTELPVTYLEGDIRTTAFGDGFDLAMLIFGELNVFSPADAITIVRKARAALKPGGCLLLEPNTVAALEYRGQQPCRWSSTTGGLFSERPHLLLQESFWSAEENALTTRYIIIDAETGAVTRYAASAQAYDDAAMHGLLTDAGFTEIERSVGLSGKRETMPAGQGLSVWLAQASA